MSNTQRLGSIWKGRAWDDGEPIPRATLPDGTLAEAMASLGYGWDSANGAFVKLLVDPGGNFAAIGGATADGVAGVNTVLDRLGKIQKASETTMRATQDLLALSRPKPPVRTAPTLLHRS